MKLSESIRRVLSQAGVGAYVTRPLVHDWVNDASALESRLESSLKSREEDGRDYRAVIEARYKDIKDLQNAYEKQCETTSVAVNRAAGLDVRVKDLQNAYEYQCGLTAKITNEVAELKDRNERQKSMIETLREEAAGLQNNLRNADLRADLAAQKAKDARERAEVLKRCNNNQFGFIREYQEEIRKLREQLERAEAKPAEVKVADRYADAYVEVRIIGEGRADVAEFVDSKGLTRIRRADKVTDTRGVAPSVCVVGRAIDFTGFHSDAGVALGRLIEYDIDSKEVRRIDDIPINGIKFQPQKD